MRHARKARGLALVLTGLLAGMLLITPATAHFTTNTKHLGKHAWQQFIKQRVYTKKQADKRFVNVGETIRHISFRGPSVSSGQLLNFKGLILRVNCPAGNETIIADTTESGGEISAYSLDASEDQTSYNGRFDDNFQPGDNLNLTTGAATTTDRMYTIIYSRPGGGAVTAHLVTENDIGGNTCLVSGYAIG